jgi:hypothetical protein
VTASWKADWFRLKIGLGRALHRVVDFAVAIHEVATRSISSLPCTRATTNMVSATQPRVAHEPWGLVIYPLSLSPVTLTLIKDLFLRFSSFSPGYSTASFRRVLRPRGVEKISCLYIYVYHRPVRTDSPSKESHLS